jgi:hypothetical protein
MSIGRVRDIVEDAIAGGTAPLLRLPVAEINWKLRSEELKQLDAFTSGTSAGSASVTSAHWNNPVSLDRHLVYQDAYVVDGGAVLRKLNDLDRDVVANVECKIRHKRNLW